MERIGIIPAAGFASRIHPLPCSKEIYPVGFEYKEDEKKFRTKVACDDLLSSMAYANVSKAFVILRNGKWDIPCYLGSGSYFKINLAYLVTDQTPGTPFTVDCAYPFAKNALILFGFPDIIFGPKDAFVRLADHQEKSKADLVLGLYRARQPQKMDMVESDCSGRVKNLVIKPRFTELKYTWIIAVWTGEFSRFLHSFISSKRHENENGQEMYVGDVINEALRSGMSADAVVIENGNYFDIGTPEELGDAIKEKM